MADNNEDVHDEEIDKMLAEMAKKSVGEINDDERLLNNEVNAMNSEITQLETEMNETRLNTLANALEIRMYKARPWLVASIEEILDKHPDELETENCDTDDIERQESEKCIVVKAPGGQILFLKNTGLVKANDLKPGDLVGINLETLAILDKLPAEYDARVKAMEVDERPTENYSDIGGLDNQIQELQEAVIFPLTKKAQFERLNISPSKGVLLYGPPGTGKTLIARACAAQTKSTFLKLAGPQLAQMYIGDGAKMVRDAFALAKEKSPTIIFIDEVDAIGTTRVGSTKEGEREVQRTMMELLNQLDGFSSTENVKVIAATNRVDVLDPALLRSGRLDRKIEFPAPSEVGRARIMQIHSRKMNVSENVNFDELSRSTETFNGAECKAVCVEAGMAALRRNATVVIHEDYVEGIQEVKTKKKKNFNYYV